MEAAKRSQRTLDEVIADWWRAAEAEQIRVQIEGGDDLRFGAPFQAAGERQDESGTVPSSMPRWSRSSSRRR